MSLVASNFATVLHNKHDYSFASQDSLWTELCMVELIIRVKGGYMTWIEYNKNSTIRCCGLARSLRNRTSLDRILVLVLGEKERHLSWAMKLRQLLKTHVENNFQSLLLKMILRRKRRALILSHERSRFKRNLQQLLKAPFAFVVHWSDHLVRAFLMQKLEVVSIL